MSEQVIDIFSLKEQSICKGYKRYTYDRVAYLVRRNEVIARYYLDSRYMELLGIDTDDYEEELYGKTRDAHAIYLFMMSLIEPFYVAFWILTFNGYKSFVELCEKVSIIDFSDTQRRIVFTPKDKKAGKKAIYFDDFRDRCYFNHTEFPFIAYDEDDEDIADMYNATLASED